MNFNELMQSKITKCNQIIDLMKKISQILYREILSTIHKSFVIPNQGDLS